MKNSLLYIAVLIAQLFSQTTYAQAPDLGSASGFVLFSSNGAVSNSGNSQITGNVGTNNGSSTAFGNVNGVMHDNDGVSALCAADVLSAYNELDAAIPTFFPAQLLGNGQILNAGIYAISGNASLNLELMLDAQNNSNAVFIIQINGAFSANAASKVTLRNGAQACNVFWKTEGMISLATGSTMRGTLIANNAAIDISSGATLEGRAFSTTGAVTLNSVLAYLPTGCGSPFLTGPALPDLGSAACYALFSTNGSVTNTGTTFVTGDIGTNNGSVTGYNPANVTGTVHLTPDASTAQAAADLLSAYTTINGLTNDIELLYPAQLGNGLVLTPHTYIMNGAATLTDTLFLNAEENVNAVFVIKVNGVLSAETYSKIALINGTQARNVFWKIEGAVNLGDYAEFAGTIICNNGAISGLNTGADLDGRALTTNGALSTVSVTADMGVGCGIAEAVETQQPVQASVYPNPFSEKLVLEISDPSLLNTSELHLFTITGKEVFTARVNALLTVLNPELPAGVYFYTVTQSNRTVQSGKLISGQ